MDEELIALPELSAVVSGIEHIELATDDVIVISTQQGMSSSQVLSLKSDFGLYLPGVNVIVLPPTAQIEAVIKPPSTE